MHLMKVIHRASPIMSAALIMTSALIIAASMSATEVSESKAETEISVSTVIAENNPKDDVPCFESVRINSKYLNEEKIFNLDICYDTEEIMMQEYDTSISITYDTGTEEADVEIYIEDDEDDQDPFSYLDEIEIPEPDYTIIPNLDPSLLKKFIEEAYKNDIDPSVVIALSESESGFQTTAESCVGCYGLMQLHPLYYPADLYDPYKNIEYGCETIGNNLKKYGDYVTALNVYANGHVGSDFTYQYDVMHRASLWRDKLIAAHII